MEELEVAKAKIEELKADLEKAKTPKQEDKIEDKLTVMLERVEALEQRWKKPAVKEEEEEEEEEDGDQCPVCGNVLNDFGNGTFYCTGCYEYFEEE